MKNKNIPEEIEKITDSFFQVDGKEHFVRELNEKLVEYISSLHQQWKKEVKEKIDELGDLITELNSVEFNNGLVAYRITLMKTLDDILSLKSLK